MSTNKELQRAELHTTIWRIANDLRGSVDGWDFKSYVLGVMFYRFISENLTRYINQGEIEAQKEAGVPENEIEFDYAELEDTDIDPETRDAIIQEKGFFIYPSQLFQNVLKRSENNNNLNIDLTSIFRSIEGSAIGKGSQSDMQGLFSDVDLNSNKLGITTMDRCKKISLLLKAISEFEIGDLQDQTIDTFGDAYEYLMTMYASNAGKSGGEFFTPQEVSELLVKIAIKDRTTVDKVYDPACGSGSLLLKFAKLLGKDGVTGGYYGQEINVTTYNLCRINMFLHNINFEKFDIACADTLLKPIHDDAFDAIVSNPPYSIKWEGDSNPLLINDPRFSPAGVLAPKSKADLAFTMHILSRLASNGTAAIVEFPGVLYRGGAETTIRKYLVENNYVDTVIQLPPDLFYGVSIATCIIVLRKNKADNSILFIDASDKFVRTGNKNKLTQENIEEIYALYRDRSNNDFHSILVDKKNIEENEFNLAVSAYIEQEEASSQIDISKLNESINTIVNESNSLREKILQFITPEKTNE